jgi:TonB family protein
MNKRFMNKIFATTLPCLVLISSTAYAADKPDPFVTYFNQLKVRAAKGDLKAEVCLGDTYASGNGAPQDYAKARSWYETAAKGGEPLAKVRIGQQYQYGYGVQRDPTRAMDMFQELYKGGFLPAAVNIGELYASGAGVQPDNAKSFEWYSKAAAGGDLWGEAHLAVAYRLGFGVKKDTVEARRWSERAADHKIDCLPTFGQFVPFLINGYLQLPETAVTTHLDVVAIRYAYKSGRAVDVVQTQSSGQPDVDKAWLDATRAAKLPPWPTGFSQDVHLAFTIPGTNVTLDPRFVAGVRDAIYAAAVLPKDVFLYGSKGKDMVNVTFNYEDGKVSDALVVESSGDAEEDAAAISAVNDAQYPATPAAYAHQKYHLSIGVRFENFTSAKPAATVSAPPATTGQLSHPPLP